MRRRRLVRKAALKALSILVIVCLWHGSCTGRSLPSEARVVAVFDGDTVLLDTGQSLRYLGIDAPEVGHAKTPADCYANEARDANSKLVLHKKIRIEYDKSTSDAHGRILGDVFLPGGRSVGAELLRTGCAVVFGKEDAFRRRGEFMAYQKEAIDGRRGMWGACSGSREPYYEANTATLVFHRPECSYARHRPTSHWKRFTSRWEALRLGYSPCRWCRP